MVAPAVGAFNDLPEAEATTRLMGCLPAPNWAGSVLSGRPYPDRESLLATAYRFGVVLDESDLVSALSEHPLSEHSLNADLPAQQPGTNVVRDRLAQVAQLRLDDLLAQLIAEG